MDDMKSVDQWRAMMKSVREWRDHLRERLRQVPEFRELELLENFIRHHEAIHTDRSSSGLGDDMAAPAQQHTEPAKRTRRSTRLTVGDASAAALEDVDHPLHLHELVAALPRYGKTPTGKRPDINLSSALSRDKRFQSVSWRGSNAWWFQGREIPSEADASGGEAAGASDAVSEEEDATEVDRAAA